MTGHKYRFSSLVVSFLVAFGATLSFVLASTYATAVFEASVFGKSLLSKTSSTAAKTAAPSKSSKLALPSKKVQQLLQSLKKAETPQCKSADSLRDALDSGDIEPTKSAEKKVVQAMAKCAKSLDKILKQLSKEVKNVPDIADSVQAGKELVKQIKSNTLEDSVSDAIKEWSVSTVQDVSTAVGVAPAEAASSNAAGTPSGSNKFPAAPAFAPAFAAPAGAAGAASSAGAAAAPSSAAGAAPSAAAKKSENAQGALKQLKDLQNLLKDLDISDDDSDTPASLPPPLPPKTSKTPPSLSAPSTSNATTKHSWSTPDIVIPVLKPSSSSPAAPSSTPSSPSSTPTPASTSTPSSSPSSNTLDPATFSSMSNAEREAAMSGMTEAQRQAFIMNNFGIGNSSEFGNFNDGGAGMSQGSNQSGNGTIGGLNLSAFPAADQAAAAPYLNYTNSSGVIQSILNNGGASSQFALNFLTDNEKQGISILLKKPVTNLLK